MRSRARSRGFLLRRWLVVAAALLAGLGLAAWLRSNRSAGGAAAPLATRSADRAELSADGPSAPGEPTRALAPVASPESRPPGPPVVPGGPAGSFASPADAVLRLRAIDPSGAPSSGVEVVARRLRDRAPLARQTSGADGRIELSVVAATELELEASGAGRAGRLGASSALAPGELRDLGDVVVGASVALRGRVIDAEGAPVADARVEARSLATPLIERLGAIERAPARPPASAADSTRTDGRGRFALEQLDRGTYEVRASRAGSAAARLAPVVASGEGAVDLVLQLGDGRALRGRVEDDTGLPLAGARVAWTTYDARLEGALARALLLGDAATSDERGEFELSGLPADRRVTIAAHAGGRQIGVLVLASPSDDPVIRLGPSAAVRGRVLAPGGALAAGAEVEIAPAGAGSDPSQAVRTASGADGSFEIDGLPPGPYRLAATRAGLRADVGPVELGLAAPPLSLELRATGLALASIDVVTDDGRPLAGARVGLRRLAVGGPPWSRSASADPWGRCAFLDVPAGRYAAAVEMPITSLFGGEDEREARGAGVRAPSVELTLESGAWSRARLIVPSEARLTVRVTREGAAVPGALVGIARAGVPADLAWPLIFGRDVTLAGLDGSAAFALPEPGRYVLHARSSSFAPVTTAEISLEAERPREPIELALADGRVAGSVVSSDGAPVAGASLRWIPGASDDRALRLSATSPFTGQIVPYELGEVFVRTSADGSFSLREVPAGSWRAEVRCPHYADARVDDVRVDAGARVRLAPIVLAPLCELGGTVVRRAESGLLVERGATVQLEDESGRRVAARLSDEHGEFTFAGLVPGPYVLTATSPNGSARRASIVRHAARNRDTLELH